MTKTGNKDQSKRLQIENNLLSTDMHFRRFGGCILNDQKQLGDNFDDVARLEDKISFFARHLRLDLDETYHNNIQIRHCNGGVRSLKSSKQLARAITWNRQPLSSSDNCWRPFGLVLRSWKNNRNTNTEQYSMELAYKICTGYGGQHLPPSRARRQCHPCTD